MQARPDPSKHLVARLFYPAPDSQATASKAAVPYIPHSNYAYGFAAYGTGSLKAWCVYACAFGSTALASVSQRGACVRDI